MDFCAPVAGVTAGHTFSMLQTEYNVPTRRRLLRWHENGWAILALLKLYRMLEGVVIVVVSTLNLPTAWLVRFPLPQCRKHSAR